MNMGHILHADKKYRLIKEIKVTVTNLVVVQVLPAEIIKHVRLMAPRCYLKKAKYLVSGIGVI
jgi:hypothetical protein